MRIIVKLFAGAGELAGVDQIEMELPPSATIRELRNALLDKCPALAPLLPHALFAVNTNYATDQTLLPEDAEVACIPPVSGG